MYAWKTKTEDITVDDSEHVELAYWRKHNRLHGWMGDLWKRKASHYNVVMICNSIVYR